MAEYIEREAVLQKKTRMTEYDEGGWGMNVSVVRMEDINAIPAADVVEVVRCKDCKYIRPEVDAYTQEAVGCWCSLLDLGSIQDEHFCSYGERKDGE